MKRLFGNEIQATHDEWLKAAEQLETEVSRQGIQVVRVPFDPTDFVRFRDAHPEIKGNQKLRQAWVVNRFAANNPDG
ncbi:hypothetical protein [Niveispirillum sp.]|uniref:hypothetical protein n=1 Tax=Niveispirillum sp. TaxID=1917217 RepID=UPI001B5B5670|nr:hypothetical protein [Niveispirillum sp.]MBP7338825.1 hypothetical protein [Niveispirillum sp.]